MTFAAMTFGRIMGWAEISVKWKNIRSDSPINPAGDVENLHRRPASRATMAR
jgi:hypothetical protein